jgi:hypothetical protein
LKGSQPRTRGLKSVEEFFEISDYRLENRYCRSQGFLIVPFPSHELIVCRLDTFMCERISRSSNLVNPTD